MFTQQHLFKTIRMALMSGTSTTYINNLLQQAFKEGKLTALFYSSNRSGEVYNHSTQEQLVDVLHTGLEFTTKRLIEPCKTTESFTVSVLYTGMIIAEPKDPIATFWDIFVLREEYDGVFQYLIQQILDNIK